MNTLLWHNNSKKSLAAAVQEAAAAHLRRLGSQPTNVILPLGEWPETVGGLKVETDKRVKGLYMQVYNGETDG
jgi:hypothetical protein